MPRLLWHIYLPYVFWELQFSGHANDEKLRSFLFGPDFACFVSPDVVEKVYFDFKKSPFDQVHAMSMLLTLS